MTFEGDLYNVINVCSDNTDALDKFDIFIESLGLSYELGNAWNMIIRKI